MNSKKSYLFNRSLISITYTDSNHDGVVDVNEIVEESNYYPFGLKHKGYNNQVTSTHYPYGFNGKEENEELGLQWLDFGARNYDASLGRWMNMDPLAETFFEDSPYIYTKNNPVLFIDPDGMASTYNWDSGRYEDENGNEVSWDEVQKEYNIVNALNEEEGSGDPPKGIGTLLKAAFNSFFGFGDKDINELQDIASETGNEHLMDQAVSLDEKNKKAGEERNEIAKTIAELIATAEPTGISGAYYAYHFGDKTDKALAVVAILPFGKVSKTVKPTGWIVRKTFNSLSPAVKKQLVKAIQKGIVAPKGANGVVKLTASQAKEFPGYTHKLKILSKEGGDIRVLGKMQNNGHIIYDKIIRH